MDVDDAPGQVAGHPGGQHLHVAGEDDEVDVVLGHPLTRPAPRPRPCCRPSPGGARRGCRSTRRAARSRGDSTPPAGISRLRSTAARNRRSFRQWPKRLTIRTARWGAEASRSDHSRSHYRSATGGDEPGPSVGALVGCPVENRIRMKNWSVPTSSNCWLSSMLAPCSRRGARSRWRRSPGGRGRTGGARTRSRLPRYGGRGRGVGGVALRRRRPGRTPSRRRRPSARRWPRAAGRRSG